MDLSQPPPNDGAQNGLQKSSTNTGSRMPPVGGNVGTITTRWLGPTRGRPAGAPPPLSVSIPQSFTESTAPTSSSTALRALSVVWLSRLQSSCAAKQSSSSADAAPPAPAAAPALPASVSSVPALLTCAGRLGRGQVLSNAAQIRSTTAQAAAPSL